MLDITILVCLYNKSISESATLQSLISSSNIIKNSKVYIWDNSPTKLNSKSLEFLTTIFENLVYKHTPENVVLSKVYNSVIDEEKETLSYLALFDDDSEIPISYFEELEKEIELNPSINLFIPQIYSASILVSPAKDYYIKAFLMKKTKIGIINSNYVTAINSGMVISNRIFIEGFRYDEKLNFYGTDNYFMYRYIQKNRNLVVLNVKIIHDLSFNDAENLHNKIRIFKEIKRANSIIYSDNKVKKSIVLFNNYIVSIKLSLKYKSLDFLYD
jgi:hypothetical protein